MREHSFQAIKRDGKTHDEFKSVYQIPLAFIVCLIRSRNEGVFNDRENTEKKIVCQTKNA